MVLYQLCQERTLHCMVNKLLLRYDTISISINLLQDVINNVVYVLILCLPVEHLEKSHDNPVDLIIVDRSTTV